MSTSKGVNIISKHTKTSIKCMVKILQHQLPEPKTKKNVDKDVSDPKTKKNQKKDNE